MVRCKFLSLTCWGTVLGLAAVPRWTSRQIYRRRRETGAAWTEPFQEAEGLQPVWNTIKTQSISSNHFKRHYPIWRIRWNTASLTMSCIFLRNTIVAIVFHHPHNHHCLLHLAFSLQLASQPLKVAVSPPHAWLLQLEDGEVCLRTKRKVSKSKLRKRWYHILTVQRYSMSNALIKRRVAWNSTWFKKMVTGKTFIKKRNNQMTSLEETMKRQKAEK